MSYNEQLRCDYLTANYEGALAWRMSPEWELYTTAVTTMGVEDKFYEGGEDHIRRIADLVRKVEPEFVAQLAVYIREQMNLRSVPLLLLIELDSCHQGDSLVSQAVSRTIQRADEIAELLMCYQWRTGKANLSGLSNQLRDGLAEAFNKFDEYQFAKYNRKNRKVTLRDALILVHPKPKDERQADIFRKIKSDTLETPVTWETELSAVGQRHYESEEEKDNAKRDVWRKLVQSHRLGYMATLRNLRNMLLLGMDDETMQMVCDFIANPEAVRKSKQLPFRFLSAFLELQKKYEDLSNQISNVQQEVEKMRQGYFFTTVRVVKRFYAESATSIFNLTKVPKSLGFRPRMKHFSYWTKKVKHFDHLPRKQLKLLENGERNLTALKQKEENYKRLQKAIESAARHTALNIPGFDKRTRVLLASDTSGSMMSSVSANSSVMIYHIGLLFSMLMKQRCKKAVTGMFGTEWKTFNLPSDGILQNTVDMISHRNEVGCDTNGYKVIDWLIEKHRVMDKVMLFTDCQLWDSDWADEHIAESWDRYKREVAPDARLYIFDLAGYGQSPVSMKRDDVYCIAGWSDKVFDILAAVERGKSAIDEIRRIVV